jgi:hypothetical protein
VVGSRPEQSWLAQLEQWVADLDAESFSARREASRQLELAGRTAYGLLAETAIQRSPEVADRALSILKRGLRHRDGPTKTAAKQALERIAATGHSATARAAQEVLQESEVSRSLVSNVGRGRMPGVAGGFGIGGNAGFGIINRPLNALNRPGAARIMPGAWPIGPVPQPQRWPNTPGMPPGFWPGPGVPGNPITAQQMELQRALRTIDNSIFRMRNQISQTADPAERERIQRQLDRSQDVRRRLQASGLFR